MGPPVDPVPAGDIQPKSADVVIVGGGIIGASAALFLARKGLSVTVCEKGHVAGEQSSRNWGWCRRMGRDPRELPLVVEALRLWARWKNWSARMSASAAPASSICVGMTKRSRIKRNG